MAVSLQVQMAVINENLKQIKSDVVDMKASVRRIEDDSTRRYVTKEEFDTKIKPIQTIVYGMVGLILSAFLTAVVTYFLRTAK